MFIGGIGEISPFSFLNALQLSAKYEFLSGGSISIPLIRIVGYPVNFNLVASSFDATFFNNISSSIFSSFNTFWSLSKEGLSEGQSSQ